MGSQPIKDYIFIFGFPQFTRQAALDALLCAVRLRSHIEVYNSLLASADEPVRFGIGIATGRVFRGNIGNIHRLEYTVLGDAVNLAARLEPMTKQFQVDILADAATITLAGEAVQANRIGIVQVRGKEQQVEVFALQAVAESCAVG